MIKVDLALCGPVNILNNGQFKACSTADYESCTIHLPIILPLLLGQPEPISSADTPSIIHQTSTAWNNCF